MPQPRSFLSTEASCLAQDQAVAAHAGAAMPLIRLLGARRMGCGTREVALQYRKGWALLTYLALERHRHQRIQLAALLWPELGETAALTNLRQVLSDLNRAMTAVAGEGVLQIDRESVRLCPIRAQGLFDVDLLECGMDGVGPGEAQSWLHDAGELLEGMALDSCMSYAEWLSCTREWIGRRLADALSVLRDVAAARGARREALLVARRLIAQDPLNELHHRALMRLHAQLGETGMALACYRTLAHRLQSELGELPSRETRDLAESIRVTGQRRLPVGQDAGMRTRVKPVRPTLVLTADAVAG